MKGIIDEEYLCCEERNSWFKRIGWFGLIWLASILCLGGVAMFFRVLMKFAGLTV